MSGSIFQPTEAPAIPIRRAPPVAPGAPAGRGAPAKAAEVAKKPGSAFARAVEAQKASPKPVAKVTLPASAWLPTYPDKPEGDVEVGIRLYSEAQAAQARAEAAQKAWRNHPQDGDEDARVEAYNGVLMALLVARATCHPEDASCPFFGPAEGYAESVVPLALMPKGIEFLFERVEDALIATGPVSPEATDGELVWLSNALADEAVWAGAPAEKARRARRLLARVVELLGGADEG